MQLLSISKMSNIMQCYKCNQFDSLLYVCPVCCNESEPICYGCSKAVNCACGRKINKPFKPNNSSKSAMKVPRIITCLTCKEIIDQLKYFVSFTCSHFLCLPCTCKAVQSKLKIQNWQLQMSRGGTQRYLQCNCYARKKENIAEFLKDHCLCCGGNFKNDKKIQLKYGLAIRQSCRRRIQYENDPKDILKFEDVFKITRTCKSCSHIIDGEIRTVGIQQYGDFQCSNCYNRLKGIKVEEKDKQESCISCDNKFSTFDLKLVDGLGLYLCQACLHRSKSTEEQNQIKGEKQKQKQKQKEVLKKNASEEREKRIIKQASKCISCDEEIVSKGAGQDNISCDKCMKEHMDLEEKHSKSRSKEQQHVSSSPLKSPAKPPEKMNSSKDVVKRYKFDIKLEEQANSELKKKVSLDQPPSKICINCSQSFKQSADVESQLSDLVCTKCIQQNIGAPAKRSASQSISPPSHLKKEQIKYRSPQQQQKWRKTATYKEFLASRQVLKFNPSVGGQGRVEGLVNRPQVRRSEEREVMYTVMQEFPNKDFLEIAPPHPRTVDCGHCGYKLSKEQAIQHISQLGKQWQLCLSCFLVCQAKSM